MSIDSGLIEEVASLRERVAALEAENQQIRAQTDERLVKRVAELAALQKVNNAANSSLQLDATLHLIAATVAEVTSSEVCSIYLFEQGRLFLRATVGLNPDAVGRVSLRLGEGITGWTAQAGQPIAVRDAWKDPRFRYNEALQEEGFSSMLSVPIIIFKAGPTLVGVINIQHSLPWDYTQEEIDFLQTVAGQIAFAIENARLYEQTDQELQRRVEELTSLRGISNVIARTLDPKEMLDVIVRETGSLIRCDAATIFQLDDTDGRLRVIAARGLASDQDGPSELATGEGVIGRVIQTGQPATSSDLLLADRAPADESVLAAGFRALCCVPLRSRAGTIGGLVVYSRGPRPFTADEIALLRTFADETAVALENARLYEDARRNLAIKSALLAEMHHRVKNNLQTIASLLSLQARHAKSDEISAPLRESVVRIRSIAAVHELLSRGEIGITSFGDLVKQIVEVAATALVEPNVRITFEFAGEDTLFASREATTVALILTELINNAVLHGLEDCSEGVIRIAAGRQNGWATVSVHDSGRGLPPDFDLSTHGQLGLQIVQTLAGTDLAGTFALTGEAGCLASIRFPSPPPVLPAE